MQKLLIVKVISNINFSDLDEDLQTNILLMEETKYIALPCQIEPIAISGGRLTMKKQLGI